MGKLGMKPVTGINRVTIKKSKAVLLYIDAPEILKSPGADNTYVIFGEVKLQDHPGPFGEKPVDMGQVRKENHPEKRPEIIIPEPKEGDSGAEAPSEEGIDPAAIDNVMSHTQCTRKKAVLALRDAGGDPVSAIISLTQ